MDSTDQKPIPKCHILAIPYQGRGHINPMMNLCKLLLSRSNNNLLITFVVTEEWLGFIGSDPVPANIRFGAIPNVLPSELVRAANMPAFIGASMTKMEEPLERLIDRLEPPPTVIIADTFLHWAVDVGSRRSIPVASLWPMAASVLSVFYHFDLFVQNGHFPTDLAEKGEERVDYIPGVSSIRVADLPTIFHGSQSEKLLPHAVKGASKINKAQYLLFTTIYELEATAINSFRSTLQHCLVYSFGPLPAHLNLRKKDNTDEPADYFKWLDAQPPCSVLYVSLGSFNLVSTAQMDEMAAGLRISGVRYLWVARAESARLREEGTGDAGVVVPWCDQPKVLSHSAVGGFWSHCGWNSVVESLCEGVPLLAFPLQMDQAPNSKFVVEDWKVGGRVERGVGMEEEVVVGREEIAEVVKRFMDPENEERKEMVRRGSEIRETCQQAIAEGGSSHTNLDSFIGDILAMV